MHRPTLDDRDARALSIIAKSIYREMRRNGYANTDAIALASVLLELVAADIAGGARASKPP